MGCVIGISVHLYVCIYMYVYTYVCDPKNSLDGTLVVNSPFQTLAVDF